jgi:hypothetical protein
LVTWQSDIEHSAGAACARPLQQRAQFTRPQTGQGEISAQVEYPRAIAQARVDIAGGKVGIRAKGMNVAPVFAGDRKDHRLRRAVIRRTRDATDVDTFALQIPDDEIAEDVVADLPPSFASAVAVLAAPPPESARKSCVATPRDWAPAVDEQTYKTPAQTTSPAAGYELTTANCIQNARPNQPQSVSLSI